MNLKGMEFTWIAWFAIEGLSLEIDDLGFGSEAETPTDYRRRKWC
jgi:hypothetical protein